VKTIQPDPEPSIPASAGSATNFGVEAEVNVARADWLSCSPISAILDAHFDNDPARQILAGARASASTGVQAAGGFHDRLSINDSTRLFATPSVTFPQPAVFLSTGDRISKPASVSRPLL